MVRVQYTRTTDDNRDGPVNVKVFDEDKKKVYFHDASDVPDFMNADEFHKKYRKDK